MIRYIVPLNLISPTKSASVYGEYSRAPGEKETKLAMDFVLMDPGIAWDARLPAHVTQGFAEFVQSCVEAEFILSSFGFHVGLCQRLQVL